MGRFADKGVLITGAASGIGRAAAVKLGSEGAAVFGVDLDTAGLVETAALVKEAGGAMESARFDLSARAGCVGSVDAAVGALGGLDVLCNIAGISRIEHFGEMSEADWQQILAINLSAPVFLCQAAIPHLLERGGNIVNAASVAGLMGQAYTVAYSITKGGVVQLTRSLAMEYVDTALRVNAIAPGGVKTAMNAKLQFPEGLDWDLIKPYMGRRGLAEAEDVATAIAYLASDDARSIHGAILSIDSGVAAG
jgi:meso-butanediol dehydrogenase/(S,S)-butanediol dehydrogenase/diacetyl reductase